MVINMKRIISLFLALVMMFTMFSVISFATEKVKLSIKNETVYAGDEFTVSLFISDNSKMSGAVIDVYYDEGALEYVSSKSGAILDENANISIKNISSTDSKVRFTYLSPNSSVTSYGVLMSITFKALENASGTTDLKISIPNAADFVTKDLTKISYEVSNPSIKIINNSVSENKDETTLVPESTSVEETTFETQTQSTTEKIENENNENNEKDNKVDVIIIAMLVAGILLVTGGIVILSKNKKKE